MKLFNKENKILKDINFLDLVPIIKVDYETLENGNVNILIPKFKSKKLRDFIIPKNKSHFIKIKLDELGSRTRISIDNKKDVGNICKEIIEQYAEKDVKIEDERIIKFISLLYQQKYITFKQLLPST